jgi:outer membrane lipopolysaccharide assembly protein LptE/RlpB
MKSEEATTTPGPAHQKKNYVKNAKQRLRLNNVVVVKMYGTADDRVNLRIGSFTRVRASRGRQGEKFR